MTMNLLGAPKKASDRLKMCSFKGYRFQLLTVVEKPLGLVPLLLALRIE